MQKAQTTNIPFMKFRFIAVLASLVLIVGSVWTWQTSGNQKFSVDFVGGVELVVSFEDTVSIGDLRSALDQEGFSQAVVQRFQEDGHTYSVRLKAESQDENVEALVTALEKQFTGKVEVLRKDFVGPVIGEQIKKNGLTALIIAIIGTLLYISIRFEFRFACGAIAALIHDVIITTGIFVFSGREISAGVLAALLTIIGYSLNDTIIIFDRVRENLGNALKGRTGGLEKSKLIQLFDDSVNQTLSRTILTSGTTLFVVASLFFFGGGAIQELSFALLVGIVVGTYSTVFIASPVVLWLAGFGSKRG